MNNHTKFQNIFKLEKITTTNIIAIVAVVLTIISIIINVCQYIQNTNYKEKIDRYSSLTNTLNFNLDMSEHFESISIETENGIKKTTMPLPCMEIQTGFPANRTLYIVYNNDIIDARTLSTGNFLDNIDFKKNISDYEITIGVDYSPCINFGEGKYGSYFFVVTDGMDGSRKIHAINYVFEQDLYDISSLIYISGKVYEKDELMKDFEDSTNMSMLKNDFDFLCTKLKL